VILLCLFVSAVQPLHFAINVQQIMYSAATSKDVFPAMSQCQTAVFAIYRITVKLARRVSTSHLSVCVLAVLREFHSAVPILSKTARCVELIAPAKFASRNFISTVTWPVAPVKCMEISVITAIRLNALIARLATILIKINVLIVRLLPNTVLFVKRVAAVSAKQAELS
jgi:hypothetical protein